MQLCAPHIECLMDSYKCSNRDIQKAFIATDAINQTEGTGENYQHRAHFTMCSVYNVHITIHERRYGGRYLCCMQLNVSSAITKRNMG